MTARAESIKVPMSCGWEFYAEVDESGYLNLHVKHNSGDIVRAMISEGYENEDGAYVARLGTESAITEDRQKRKRRKKE